MSSTRCSPRSSDRSSNPEPRKTLPRISTNSVWAFGCATTGNCGWLAIGRVYAGLGHSPSGQHVGLHHPRLLDDQAEISLIMRLVKESENRDIISGQRMSFGGAALSLYLRWRWTSASIPRSLPFSRRRAVRHDKRRILDTFGDARGFSDSNELIDLIVTCDRSYERSEREDVVAVTAPVIHSVSCLHGHLQDASGVLVIGTSVSQPRIPRIPIALAPARDAKIPLLRVRHASRARSSRPLGHDIRSNASSAPGQGAAQTAYCGPTPWGAGPAENVVQDVDLLRGHGSRKLPLFRTESTKATFVITSEPMGKCSSTCELLRRSNVRQLSGERSSSASVVS